MKTINYSKSKACIFMLLCCFFTPELVAQKKVNAGTNNAIDIHHDHPSLSWTIDDNNNENPGYFRWWTDGGDDISELLMELDASDKSLNLYGPLKAINKYTPSNSGEYLTLWAGGLRSFIQSHGDEEGLNISSKTGNKIFVGDENDQVYLSHDFSVDKNGRVGIGVNPDIDAKLYVSGFLRVVNKDNPDAKWRNLSIWSEDRFSYIQSINDIGGGLKISSDFANKIQLGDTDDVVYLSNNVYLSDYAQIKSTLDFGLLIRSVIGDKIHLGDEGDLVTISNLKVEGDIRAEKSFGNAGTDDLRLGLGAGEGVSNNTKGTHVFIGKDAGSKSGFDAINVIDYADDTDSNPITGIEYLDDNSVFVLNNSADLSKPLLFGNFADDKDANSMAQLAINTHHVIDSVALTVSGAVHIGPKNLDPNLFPAQDAYTDALLWVERGIVTENVTYAFISSWEHWPDYVFEEDYDLMNLNELEAYIQKEKHLPGIVSGDQVKEEGLNSREMITDLLLKIEELTLYTIDQEKKIEAQKQLNETLMDRLTAIEEQLNKNR